MTEAIGGGYAVELWLTHDYASGLQGDVDRELGAEMESARLRGRVGLTAQVEDGFAILTGQVRCWGEKVAARRAVMRVPGITAIDDRAVLVWPEAAESRTDSELMHMALAALAGDSRVPPAAVRVAVGEGRITLTGTLAHEDEREAAEQAVTFTVGAREVINAITVPARVRPPHPLTKLQEALERAVGREAKHVRVLMTDAGVELRGRLSSLALRGAAEAAVRRVLGDVPVALKLH